MNLYERYIPDIKIKKKNFFVSFNIQDYELINKRYF